VAEREQYWTVEAPQALAWFSWDTETVLYDERSGDIHYFDEAISTIFERIVQGPRSFDDLVIFAADRLQVVADSEMEAMVSEILMILRDKQVVTPAG